MLYLLVGLAAAGLLNYYGKVVGTANVAQSVKVDDHNWNEPITETIQNAIAGDTYYTEHIIKNYASRDAFIRVENVNKTGPDGDPEGEGVTVGYGLIDRTALCQNLSGWHPYYTDVFPGNYEKKLCIRYQFAINAYPGNYNITTQISTT